MLNQPCSSHLYLNTLVGDFFKKEQGCDCDYSAYLEFENLSVMRFIKGVNHQKYLKTSLSNNINLKELEQKVGSNQYKPDFVTKYANLNKCASENCKLFL